MMSDDQAIAYKTGQIASKMAQVARILTKPTLTEADLRELDHGIGYLRNKVLGVDVGLTPDVLALIRAAAVRMVAVGVESVERAEVKPFGNGGHIVLPQKLVGRDVVYAPLPDTED